MPFAAPFAEFTEGDLVYGVEVVRRGPAARRWYIDNLFKPKGAATIDEFDPIPRGAHKPAPADQASFQTTLAAHPRYASADIGLADLLEISDAGGNSATRRKDKAGLYWATMVATRTVHFVLDGIDQKAVVDKSFAGKSPDRPAGKASAVQQATKTRSITGSELRWIYRNRNLPNVQANIQFWLNKVQVVPPWEADAELWAQYTPTTVSVHHDDEESSGCCVVC